MRRNPRRAYNPDGSEIPPATVGSQRSLGRRKAEISCLDCSRSADISTDAFPPDVAIPDLCLQFRCSRCGSKNLQSRPSVHEHYARLYQHTGMNYGNAISLDALSGPEDIAMLITTQAEYEAAWERVFELGGCLVDTPEERELIEVRLAIEIWETKHVGAAGRRD